MFILVLGWMGAALLCAAPFIIDRPLGKYLAIAGLFILTIQSFDAELYNLVLLNIIGIVGYSWNLKK